MIKLKIIAFFLSLLMVMQMLPIVQIGQLLSSNQMIEELPHNANDHGSKAEGSFQPNFFPPLINIYVSVIAESKILAYLHAADQIPSNHSSDVIDQPPNLIA